jgi:GrpB-like predicted nucleotidyltransferase (UPF0157 family)
MKLSIEALQQLHNSRKTYIVDYSPQWASDYKAEATLLKAIFKDAIFSIHHIGSTSIPGMKAKPIIDILMTTDNLERIDDFDTQMEYHGYVVGGEFGLPGRRFFCKGNQDHCKVHIHVYEISNPVIEKYILFRDYLIAYPNEVKDYEALKVGLAEKYPHNRTLYTQNKSAYITKILTKAIKWKNNFHSNSL